MDTIPTHDGPTPTHRPDTNSPNDLINTIDPLDIIIPRISALHNEKFTQTILKQSTVAPIISQSQSTIDEYNNTKSNLKHLVNDKYRDIVSNSESINIVDNACKTLKSILHSIIPLYNSVQTSLADEEVTRYDPQHTNNILSLLELKSISTAKLTPSAKMTTTQQPSSSSLFTLTQPNQHVVIDQEEEEGLFDIKSDCYDLDLVYYYINILIGMLLLDGLLTNIITILPTSTPTQQQKKPEQEKQYHQNFTPIQPPTLSFTDQTILISNFFFLHSIVTNELESLSALTTNSSFNNVVGTDVKQPAPTKQLYSSNIHREITMILPSLKSRFQVMLTTITSHTQNIYSAMIQTFTSFLYLNDSFLPNYENIIAHLLHLYCNHEGNTTPTQPSALKDNLINDFHSTLSSSLCIKYNDHVPFNVLDLISSLRNKKQPSNVSTASHLDIFIHQYPMFHCTFPMLGRIILSSDTIVNTHLTTEEENLDNHHHHHSSNNNYCQSSSSSYSLLTILNSFFINKPATKSSIITMITSPIILFILDITIALTHIGKLTALPCPSVSFTTTPPANSSLRGVNTVSATRKASMNTLAQRILRASQDSTQQTTLSSILNPPSSVLETLPVTTPTTTTTTITQSEFETIAKSSQPLSPQNIPHFLLLTLFGTTQPIITQLFTQLQKEDNNCTNSNNESPFFTRIQSLYTLYIRTLILSFPLLGQYNIQMDANFDLGTISMDYIDLFSLLNYTNDHIIPDSQLLATQANLQLKPVPNHHINPVEFSSSSFFESINASSHNINSTSTHNKMITIEISRSIKKNAASGCQIESSAMNIITTCANNPSSIQTQFIKYVHSMFYLLGKYIDNFFKPILMMICDHNSQGKMAGQSPIPNFNCNVINNIRNDSTLSVSTLTSIVSSLITLRDILIFPSIPITTKPPPPLLLRLPHASRQVNAYNILPLSALATYTYRIIQPSLRYIFSSLLESINNIDTDNTIHNNAFPTILVTNLIHIPRSTSNNTNPSTGDQLTKLHASGPSQIDSHMCGGTILSILYLHIYQPLTMYLLRVYMNYTIQTTRQLFTQTWLHHFKSVPVTSSDTTAITIIPELQRPHQQHRPLMLQYFPLQHMPPCLQLLITSSLSSSLPETTTLSISPQNIILSLTSFVTMMLLNIHLTHPPPITSVSPNSDTIITQYYPQKHVRTFIIIMLFIIYTHTQQPKGSSPFDQNVLLLTLDELLRVSNNAQSKLQNNNHNNIHHSYGQFNENVLRAIKVINQPKMDLFSHYYQDSILVDNTYNHHNSTQNKLQNSQQPTNNTLPQPLVSFLLDTYVNASLLSPNTQPTMSDGTISSSTNSSSSSSQTSVSSQINHTFTPSCFKSISRYILYISTHFALFLIQRSQKNTFFGPHQRLGHKNYQGHAPPRPFSSNLPNSITKQFIAEFSLCINNYYNHPHNNMNTHITETTTARTQLFTFQSDINFYFFQHMLSMLSVMTFPLFLSTPLQLYSTSSQQAQSHTIKTVPPTIISGLNPPIPDQILSITPLTSTQILTTIPISNHSRSQLIPLFTSLMGQLLELYSNLQSVALVNITSTLERFNKRTNPVPGISSNNENINNTTSHGNDNTVYTLIDYTPNSALFNYTYHFFTSNIIFSALMAYQTTTFVNQQHHQYESILFCPQIRLDAPQSPNSISFSSTWVNIHPFVAITRPYHTNHHTSTTGSTSYPTKHLHQHPLTVLFNSHQQLLQQQRSSNSLSTDHNHQMNNTNLLHTVTLATLLHQHNLLLNPTSQSNLYPNSNFPTFDQLSLSVLFYRFVIPCDQSVLTPHSIPNVISFSTENPFGCINNSQIDEIVDFAPTNNDVDLSPFPTPIKQHITALECDHLNSVSNLNQVVSFLQEKNTSPTKISPLQPKSRLQSTIDVSCATRYTISPIITKYLCSSLTTLLQLVITSYIQPTISNSTPPIFQQPYIQSTMSEPQNKHQSLRQVSFSTLLFAMTSTLQYPILTTKFLKLLTSLFVINPFTTLPLYNLQQFQPLQPFSSSSTPSNFNTLSLLHTIAHNYHNNIHSQHQILTAVIIASLWDKNQQDDSIQDGPNQAKVPLYK